MKQIGNLAIRCALRSDVAMQIIKGEITVNVGEGPQRAALVTAWDDDEKIKEIIRELNFGRFRLRDGQEGYGQ